MIINGKCIELNGETSITSMLNSLKLSHDKVVVEVNMDIIPRDQYDIKFLSEDDTVEVISFVGGG